MHGRARDTGDGLGAAVASGLAHAGGWEVVSSQGVLHIREGNAGFKVASVGNCNEGQDITAKLIRLGPGRGHDSHLLRRL